MEETINIKGEEYQVIRNEDGTTSLLKFNNTYKMWVQIDFAREKNPELEDQLIKMLSRIYIERVTGER